MSTGALAKKLAEVMGVANRIPKRGRNDFHKYDYATEADIAEAIRKELAERGVMLFPEIIGIERVPVGEKGSVLTTLTMNFTFIDGETGDTITRRWAGAGTDKEDKGLYKAMTGGEKYFLLKTFLMPTGDDPEAHTADDKKKQAAPTVEVVAPKAIEKRPIPTGAVRLAKTEQHETSAGKRYWLLVLSTGEEVIEWREQAAAFAEQAAQDGVPVVIKIQSGEWNGKWVVRDIVKAEQGPKPNGSVKKAKELTVDEVPF